ncbi:MAG: response regulator [Calditrichaeota bacterium]|nr:response regulator [Calditrichota bacterium]
MGQERFKKDYLADVSALQQVQNSFAMEKNLGIMLFDDGLKPITSLSTGTFSPDAQDAAARIFLEMFFSFNKDVFSTGINYGEPIFASFLGGKIFRALVPIIIQDELAAYAGLIRIHEALTEDQIFLYSSLNTEKNKTKLLLQLLDANEKNPPGDFVIQIEEFKEKIKSMIELSPNPGEEMDDLIARASAGHSEDGGALWVFADPFGEIRAVSTGAFKLLGYESKDEMIGLNIVHDLILEQSALPQNDSKPEPEWNVALLQRKDGSDIKTAIKIIPQHNDQQKVFGYKYFLRPIMPGTDELQTLQTKAGTMHIFTPEEENMNELFTFQSGLHGPTIIAEDEDIDEIIRDVTSKTDPVLYLPNAEKIRSDRIDTAGAVAQIIDSLPYPLFVLDEKNRIAVWNILMEDILKISAGSVLNADFEILLFDDSRSQWSKLIDDFRMDQEQNKISPDEDITLLDKFGNIVRGQVSLSKSLIYGEKFISITIDKIKQTANSFENAFSRTENVASRFYASIITDLEGNILNANIESFKVFGFSEDSLPRISRFLPAETGEDLIAMVRNLGPQDILGKNIVVITHTGQRNTFVTIQKLVDEESNEPQLYWHFADIDNSVKNLPVEPVSKKISVSPVPGVDNKNNSILYNMAENYENLSAEIHDIASKLLQDRRGLKKTNEIVFDIEEIAGQAADAAKNLKYFMQSEIISPEYIILNAFLTDILNDIRNIIPESIQVIFEQTKDSEKVYADKRFLRHAVHVLCENAVEAMPRGGKIVITVQQPNAADAILAKNGTRDTDYILLNIQDNGCGIEESRKETLFEPFKSNQQMSFGRGFGLASVFGIVKSHNGFIAVESEPGKGTSVSLYLPKKEVTSTSMINDPEQEAEKETKTKTILIVDDDQGIVEVTKTALSFYHFKVLSAGTVKEGVRILKENSDDISLIILDVHLPDCEGLECAEALYEFSAGTPFIFSSGSPYDPTFSEFMKRTPAKWMQKPYMSMALLQNIEALISKDKDRY